MTDTTPNTKSDIRPDQNSVDPVQTAAASPDYDGVDHSKLDNNASPNLVEVRGLHFRRGRNMIFKGLDVDIIRGKITTIMGPSGTGKTTLLKIIGAQLKPHRGVVHFDGHNVHKLSRRNLFDLRKRMGMLFQSGALLTDLTVFENVAFPLREHTELTEEQIQELVLKRLHAVGLRGARRLKPAQLSGGMSRRVALARALVLDPDIIMYDEPFTGQDPISLGVLVELISRMNQTLGITSVIVSHDIKESLSISDYVIIISDGKVVATGTPKELCASDSSWVRQFLDGKPDGPVPFHYKAPNDPHDILGP